MCAAFGLGEDDKHIAPMDAAGVALAAVKELQAMVRQNQEMVREKDAQIAAMQERLAAVEKMLARGN